MLPLPLVSDQHNQLELDENTSEPQFISDCAKPALKHMQLCKESFLGTEAMRHTALADTLQGCRFIVWSLRSPGTNWTHC